MGADEWRVGEGAWPPARLGQVSLFYSLAMATTAASVPSGFRRIFAWPRLRFTLIFRELLAC